MTHPVGADPSDPIVGSWRLPAPFRRVPALVWAFTVAALIDAAVRTVSVVGGFQQVSENPLLAIPVLVSWLPAAGLLFMPGAVLLGRWTGFAGRAAMAGAILLAASELVALALRLIPFESLVPTVPQDVETFGRGLGPVRVVGAFLYLAGLVFLLWAVVVARAGTPGTRARFVAAGLVGVAILSAMEGLRIFVVSVQSNDANGFSMGALDLASAAMSIAAGVVWGLLAAAAILGRSAARDRRHGWTALAAGAALVVITSASWDVATAAVMLGLLAPGSEGPYLVLSRVSEVFYPLATALVVIGLAVGLADHPVPKPVGGELAAEPEPQLG
jgi:hypothetical protein